MSYATHGKNASAIKTDKQVSSMRPYDVPKSTKTARWCDHVQASTQGGELSTSFIIESSWPSYDNYGTYKPSAFEASKPKLRQLFTKAKNTLMLDARRNEWYIGLDDRNLAVDGRRVNEAMCDHADHIMYSCAMWREAAVGNKKLRDGLLSTTRSCTARDIIRILTQRHRTEEGQRELINWLRGRAIKSTR